jgi:hypothetical protein
MFLLCDLNICNLQTKPSISSLHFFQLSKPLHLSEPLNPSTFTTSKANQLKMFGRSRFTYFITFLLLLGPALAADKYVYRMDFRSPEDVERDGGLVARNPEGTGSVIDHVYNTLGDDDPWVSTTSSEKLARKGAQSPGKVYVYRINVSGLRLKDTRKEFEKAGEEHPKPGEKEYSVKEYIPWSNIDQWETFKGSKSRGITTKKEYYNRDSEGSSSKGSSSKKKKGSTSGGSPKGGRSKRSFIA